MVTALGISGAKGRAFSLATLVSSNRTASDTVKPMAASTVAASSLTAPSIRALDELICRHVVVFRS